MRRKEMDPIKGEEIFEYLRLNGRRVSVGNPWSFILMPNGHEMKGELVGVRRVDDAGNRVRRISATEDMVDHLRSRDLLY